ncbi:host attachment protein [Salinicola corii]|uniref:Host attachment protein n=1 Tax=Salinicola corii TaxID=2606937 RepID=A0A640WC57_9GAMM|nr:host attachment protein [Salinicola corii]KAA0017208.1 host attachment protein [Salinicola corii]
MDKIFVVAADASRARVFAREARVLREIETLTHPESRMHTGDLRTGGEGSATSGASQRQTGNDDATSEKQAMFFAKEVAGYLRNARTQGKADKFVLIAAPQFLGQLRDKLDKPTLDCVIQTLDKDLSKASEEEIAGKLD